MKIVGGKYTPLPSSVSAELRAVVATLLQQRPQFRASADALLLTPALSNAAMLLTPTAAANGVTP
eukprot:CAMPEP_0115886416 /NCGR_PEP_ID=MMETSP0287-20121206/31194_1 /TAXON_ID=412157 /ORGANISM="Chrysochromulina rotalis, Strain UIO044" /LENGTH=64 /DNA_ID=CAMNT_0003342895 /DNA_START=17 /DNA_END=208 /DNA_ORIENTATION=-